MAGGKEGKGKNEIKVGNRKEKIRKEKNRSHGIESLTFRLRLMYLTIGHAFYK